MAANIIWGKPVEGEKSTLQGKIGISTTISQTVTHATVKVQVWFASMYSCTDSSNNYYFDANATKATSLVGSVSIKHTVNSGGGWNESNRTLLGEYTFTYTKGTSVQTKYYSAKLTNVEGVGVNNVMTVSVSVSIDTLPTVTITYNATNGSGAPQPQTKYWGTDIYLSNATPTRTGYVFQSWNTKSDGTGTSYGPGSKYSANAAVTLYAIWSVIYYTITYNGNGGSISSTQGIKYYGLPLALPSAGTRADYEFKGWSTSANGAVVYNPGEMYYQNESKTLYAVWELVYVKPRIWGLKVTRCDQNGTDDDAGVYARVEFSWSTDKNIDGYTIEWTSESASGGFEMFTSSGTSKTESKIVGGSLSADSTYTIKIILWDTQGVGSPEYNSYAFATLPGRSFPIDILEDVGIAFGKPAELEEVADFGWKVRFNKGILPPVLPPGTDLDDIFTPNTYVGANITDNTYGNCPVTTGTFTLIVISGGEHGQVRQEFISCDMSRPRRFVRFYHSKSDGTQGWGNWMSDSSEEIVLYENSSGTTGSIGLPDSTLYRDDMPQPSSNITDYKYLEIYYTDNNGLKGGYTKIQNPAYGDYICLSITEAADGFNIYFRQSKYVLQNATTNGKISLTLKSCSYLMYNYSTGGFTHSEKAYPSNNGIGTNYIKIKKIVGRV